MNDTEKRMIGNHEVISSINIGRKEVFFAIDKQNTDGEKYLCGFIEKNDLFESAKVFFQKLASASTVEIKANKDGIEENAVAVIVNGAQIFIPMGELVDFEKEIERLENEKKTLLSEIKRVEGKLSNKGFVDKAPAHVVEEEKAKGEKYRQMLNKVEESLEAFKKEVK